MLTAAFVAQAGAVAFAADIKEPRLTADDYGHWSFQPVKRPAPPKVKDAAWPRNAIDHFILSQLEKHDLSPMPQAGKQTLIRRVTFDLTGLPPTPAEVDAFLKDTSPDAYEKLVDRLLASSAYGERWAQHWLDVARFAETDGFEHDKVRPHAWKYRDWVIAALNEDMPYDRFIRSQLAGDELADGHDSIATGFLMAGPDFPDINSQEERRDAKLNEMTATVGQAILGLTVGCAQCHDHKFDSISHADFYRLRAVFAGTLHPKKDKLFDTVVSEPGPVPPPSFLMLRGDFRRPGPPIEPGFLRVLNKDNLTIAPAPKDAKSSGRRAALARWLTRPDHPLTARVAVNRIWLHHFGRGIVTTPGDFGYLGDTPTHPQLLDWLAVEFVEGAKNEGRGEAGDRGQETGDKGQETRGLRAESQISDLKSEIANRQSPRPWSQKHLHRLILTSATYMQASRADDEAWDDGLRALAAARWQAGKEGDRFNDRYWRMPRRRLEGEAVRDAMLLAAGRLSERKGGPGVMPPLPAEVAATLLNGQWKVSPDVEDHYRRSIYLFARRNLRYPLFEVFDKPDTNASCPQRPRSTTATQSLTLLNAHFSLEMARLLAGEALAASPDDQAGRIAFAWRRTLGRSPTAGELKRIGAFLADQSDRLRQENRPPAKLALPDPMPKDADRFDAAAMVDVCLMLFNISEFIYID